MKLKRLSCLVSLSLVCAVPQATTTDLADNPLPVVTSTEPNIMFMVDSSGSMNNIVPPAMFAKGTSCTGSNRMADAYADAAAASGGDYFDLAVLSDGTPKIKGAAYYNYGTSGSNKCFEDNKYYNARLYAITGSTCTISGIDVACSVPTSYLPAIYKGDFLNWYYSGATLGTVINFGANAQRKPTTETRMEVAKVSTKAVVDSLSGVRSGLATYNAGEGGSLRENIGTLSAAKKTAIKSKIDALDPAGATPLAETLSDIGRYFSTPYTGALTLHPGAATPTSSAVATVFNNHEIANATGGQLETPIQYWCQKSFAVLVTDGRPQSDQSVSAGLCDYLGIMGGTCSSSPWGKKTNQGTGTPPYHTRTVGGITYKQLHEGGAHNYESAGSDYMDDVAGALFDIDLRPDLTNPAGLAKKNNLSTYVVGFADEMVKNDALLQETATAGGGVFKTADDATQLAQVFKDLTDSIIAQNGASAAVAVANAQVTSTDNASYSTSYNSGTWTGDLIAYPIDITTGVPVITTPVWTTGCASPAALVDPNNAAKGVLGCSAQVQLDTLATPVTSRKIVTSTDTVPCNANCGIQFQPTTAGTSTRISATQRVFLSTPTTTDGDAVLGYLRGATNTAYRTRAHLLGDPINAEPLLVREPPHNYADPGYATYKSNNSARTRVVVQAANDGMVHVFDALTGAELWAYVPNLLISSSRDPNNSSTSLLNTRSRKVTFNHYPLIDATPVQADVDFGYTGVATPGTVDWRTIVVGGLGKGGRGFYALDLTTTTAASETAAAGKVLWEFPNSITNATARAAAINNTGYSFGKPVIVKTEALGWVVLITSGYNNGGSGDGEAHLFVLNAKTGDLIADISSFGCTSTPASNPCGMAHISAWVDNSDFDNIVEHAYGGDLYGNVWRFNLTGSSSASWSISRLATLNDGTNPQPITSSPELATISISGAGKRFVYVGTGQYLGNSDLPCSATCPWTPNAGVTQTQTMYALVDPMTGATLAAPIRSSLVAQTYSTIAGTPPKRVLSTNAVNFTTKNGWYIDFTGGERVVSDPAIAAGVLVFTTILPSDAVCAAGGTSWLYAVDYKTGAQVAGSSYGGLGIMTGLASRPVLIQLPSGKIKALLRLSDATTQSGDVPQSPSAAFGKRVSWRELVD